MATTTPTPTPIIPTPTPKLEKNELPVYSTSGVFIQGGTNNFIRVAGTATTSLTTNGVGTTTNQIQIYNDGGLTATFDVDGLYSKSLTLSSHLVLSSDGVPTSSNRPTGTRGLVRYNDTNKSAEIYDGSSWVDVGYYAGIPLGAIIAYPSDTPPSSSFLLCNGATLNAVTNPEYADLYNVITTKYGGTSNSSFNLPNTQGRTIVGKNNGTFNTLGGIGGVESVTLIDSQIPSHNHSIPSVNVTGSLTFNGNSNNRVSNEGHVHLQNDNRFNPTDTTWANGCGWGAIYCAGANSTSWDPNTRAITTNTNNLRTANSTATYHSHTYTPSGTINGINTISVTQSTDSSPSSAHNNMQPYIVVNYFIKVVKDSKPYALTSDVRVKRNIISVDSNQAMDAIQMLQPKRYEYIDKNMSEFSHHIGFIAQEAKQCIPESVCTKKEFIPNIYSMAKLNQSEHGILLTSVQHPITKLIKEQLITDKEQVQNEIKGVKLKMFNKSKECFYVSCVEEVDDYNIIVESVSDILSADYFVYGQEIDDYHYMNNDAIFATLVAAVKALDTKCKEQDDILSIRKDILKTQQEVINKLIQKKQVH